MVFFRFVVMLWLKGHKVLLRSMLERHIGCVKSNYCVVNFLIILFCLQRVARLISAGEPVGHIMSVLAALSIRV